MILGVGIYTKCKYDSKSREYGLWSKMFTRCYSASYLKLRPSYAGCSVDPRFHRFDEFVEWAETQSCFTLAGSELDKDLLFRNNKIYSPDTCVFIPQELNTLLTKSEAARGTLPIGVSKSRNKTNYEARMSVNGVQTSLGYFGNPEDAFIKYKCSKEAYIKEMAEKYKAELDVRAYLALLKYEIRIDD